MHIDSLERVLSTYQEMDSNRVDLLNQLGYEYWIVDPTQSEKYGIQAFEISKLLPYVSGKAYAQRVVGVAHWVRGNSDLAFRFLLGAERDYQVIQDSTGWANSMLNLGMVYHDQRRFDKSMRKYNRALEIFESLQLSSRVATTYTKMADGLIEQENFEDAYRFLVEALAIHQEEQFLYGIAEVNSKLGKLFNAKGEFSKAISYYLLAVEAGGQRNDQVGLADYYYNIAYAYTQKQDVQQAKTYLRLSEELAEQYDLKKIKKDVYRTFKDTELNQGNYKNAIKYYDRYIELKDTLFNEEISNIISNMEAKSAFLEKEQELKIAQSDLALLKQKNKNDQMERILFVLGIAVLLALGWGMLQRKNRSILKKNIDLAREKKRSGALEDKITSKEQELTSYTLNFVEKNERILDIQKSLESLKSDLRPELQKNLKGILRKIDSAMRMDEDWSAFRQHFESVHPNLIVRLNQAYPDLTKSEFKLIALMRLKMSSKEISSVLGISPDSVKTARYRLRKKLGIESGENLFDFLISFESQTESR